MTRTEPACLRVGSGVVGLVGDAGRDESGKQREQHHLNSGSFDELELECEYRDQKRERDETRAE